MTPGENGYISGYEGPNEIYQDVPVREWNLVIVVKFSNPKGETMRHGSPYKFIVMNSP